MVDIWDARTKELLWRGTAVDTVIEDPAKNDKNMKKAMAKMFKRYPLEKTRRSENRRRFAGGALMRFATFAKTTCLGDDINRP